MLSPTTIYPPSPKNVDSKLTDPSPQFRREVVKVLWSILLFIVVYIFLVLAAAALAALLGYGGIMLIAAFPKLITLAIGAGLIGIGVFVLFFLFKFIFSSKKVDRTNLVEITRKDHPLLFEFLHKVATETQTRFPKHVYLSADVNACVFYDSGFWSMFLPVSKNLQIGLGLVNSVNVSEFKAIIAHEFGHFSQRSMKLGSYVYNVNKVIYNMLYDNDDYKQSLQTWAGMTSYFSVFADLTAGIVSIIQSILKIEYNRINTGYMALSRQMEFHADSVAASVSGSKPLITSLRRFDVADNCFQCVLDYYDRWYKQNNRKACNIYEDHSTVMLHFATEHGLTTDHGLVQVTTNTFAGFPQSRVNIKDQWASHPSTGEREKHLNQLNISSDLVKVTAWQLFTNPEAVQQQLTDHLYRTLSFKTEPVLVQPSAFKTIFTAEVDKYSFDKAYKNFYDDRMIKPFDLNPSSTDTLAANTLDEVLTAEIAALPVRIRGLQNEVEMLKAISLKNSLIETFEFNNKKYEKEDANALIMEVHKELDDAKATLEKADQDIFLLYHQRATQQGRGAEASQAYTNLFSFTQTVDERISDLEWVIKEAAQLYENDVTLEKAVAVSRNMTRKEGPIKTQISEMLADSDGQAFLTSDEKEILQRFVSKEWEYFTDSRLHGDAIDLFFQAMNIYGASLSKRTFELKKQVLTKQLHMITSDRLQSVN